MTDPVPWANWKPCERHVYSSSLQVMIDCPDCETPPDKRETL